MDDELLVSLVQEYELLYNKQLPDFKNLDKKRETWESIGIELSASADACMKRWTVLRDRYVRKCRHGDKSDWHLFDTMTFLDPHIQPRKARRFVKSNESDTCPVTFLISEVKAEFVNTMSQAPETMPKPHSSCSPEIGDQYSSNEFVQPSSPIPFEDSVPPLSPSQSTQSSTSRSSKRKESPIDKAFLDAVNCFKKVCETQISTKNVAVESFGRMIVATICDMSPAKQAVAMKEVTNLVMALKNEPEEDFI